ncbi:MAG: hypothetical protein HZR80_15605 [Candidatus Heimdallarchaeota archaeon]
MGYDIRYNRLYPADYDEEYSAKMARDNLKVSPIKALLIGLLLSVLMFGFIYLALCF